MNINEILTGMNTLSQNIVKFLFGSKYSIWIIILIVVIYLIWKGLEARQQIKIVDSEIKKIPKNP